MKRLFEIDLQDYEDGDRIFARPSARGIIFKNNKIALVYSKNETYYKFPGGGILGDEDRKEAGFILRFVALDEAISVNSAYKSEDIFNEIMIKRETKVLRMLRNTMNGTGNFIL